MKPINENIFAIPVPMDAEDFRKEDGLKGEWTLNYRCEFKGFNVGKIHFIHFDFEILGTITATECSFNCSEITNEWKGCNCGECFDFVKEKIEIATGYLFENPVSHPIEIEPTSRNHYEAVKSKWQQHQDRVIEKLLIIKKK